QGNSPVVASTQGASQVDAAVSTPMGDVLSRVVRNQYVKSFEALLALSPYRFLAFLQWLPVLLVVVVAGLLLWGILRALKSREFLQHKPELFALYGCAVIVCFFGGLVAFVVPVTLHPFVLPIVPIPIGVFGSFAISNYHRRG